MPSLSNPFLTRDMNGRNRWSFHASRRLLQLSGQTLTRCPTGSADHSHHTRTPRGQHRDRKGQPQGPPSSEIKGTWYQYLHPQSWAPVRTPDFRLRKKTKTDLVLDLVYQLPVHLCLKPWERAHSLPARETVQDWFSLGWNYLNNNIKHVRLVLLTLEPGRQDTGIVSFYSANG